MRKILPLIFILLFSCKDTFEFDSPLVLTGEIDYSKDSGVTFSARITSRGKSPIVESGFVWSLYSKDDDGIKVKNSDPSTDAYSLHTNYDPLPNKIYYVRAYVKTAGPTIYGRELSFKSAGDTSVARGSWTKLKNNNAGSLCVRVSSTFSLNDFTYILLSDNEMYSYNHTSGEFKYIFTNNIVGSAQLSTVYNGKAYIFYQDSFYNFNPTDLSFKKLSVWQGNDAMIYMTGFLIDDNIYIGLGMLPTAFKDPSGYTKDFWRYNISTDSWQKISDFPGNFRANATSFSADGYGYVGGGFNFSDATYEKNDLWQFDPAENLWRKRKNLPFQITDIFQLQAAPYQDQGYCFYKGELYEYSIFDTWQKMASLGVRTCYPNLFSSHGKIFIVDVNEYSNVKYFDLWSYAK